MVEGRVSANEECLIYQQKALPKVSEQHKKSIDIHMGSVRRCDRRDERNGGQTTIA